jgi:glycogen operon protein
MILAGDELGHTQKGNNNAYCQDNQTTWLNWDLNERQKNLLGFVRHVIQLRHEHPVFRRRRFFSGKAIEGADAPDIAWLNVDGSEITTETWSQGWVKSLGVILFGDSIDVDECGEEISGDTMLVLFNAAPGHVISFALPELDEQQPWAAAGYVHAVASSHPFSRPSCLRSPTLHCRLVSSVHAGQ